MYYSDFLRSLVADFPSCDAASALLAELEDGNEEENEDDDDLEDMVRIMCMLQFTELNELGVDVIYLCYSVIPNFYFCFE